MASTTVDTMPRGSTSITTQARRRGFPAGPAVVLGVILAAQLMVTLDATVVSVALPQIQHALGYSSGTLSWVLNAYIISFGGLLLLGARAGDLLGRRRTFLVGIAIFTLASLAGGFSNTGWMLLAMRAIQGIGGALAAPASLALITRLYPEGQQKVRAIAMFTAVSTAGAAVGMVAGGMLIEWASWRWVMFVNVPVGVVVWLLGRKVIAETPSRTGHFDFAGAITSTVGMTGIVLGLVEAGSSGWAKPITVVPLFVGVALLGMFVRVEQAALEPILPLHLVTHRTRISANVARGLVYAGMYGVFFFLTQFLQEVQGRSALQAGFAFLPIPLSVFAGSQLTTRVLIGRVSSKAIMLGGTVLAFAGLALTTTIGTGTSYAEVVPDLIIFGLGCGTSLVSLMSAALHEVASEHAGAASGLVNVTQQIGAALGLAALVTVFDTSTGIHGSLSGGARHTIVHGLDLTFAAGAAFALIAVLLVAVVVRTPRPDAELELARVEL